MEYKLPPLPEPAGAIEIDFGEAPGGGREVMFVDGFNAAQMQAYAIAAIEAQASVQQEPLAWLWQHEDTGREGFVSTWQLKNGWQAGNPRLSVVCPLYTHQAQQAKPQPLSDEKVLALYQKYGTSRLDGFTAAIRDAEAAHGIQGS